MNRRRDRPRCPSTLLSSTILSFRSRRPPSSRHCSGKPYQQYAASVLRGGFIDASLQIHARIAPHCSRRICPRHAGQREGNEKSVPRPFLCAGLFAHGVEKVHRKEADQQPSQHCRVVRKAGNPVATARQKGGGGRTYTVPKAKTLIRCCCNPRRRHDGKEVRREERGSLVSGPTGGKTERHGGCHA